MDGLLLNGTFGCVQKVKTDHLNGNIHIICVNKINHKTVIQHRKNPNEQESHLLLKLKGQPFRNVRLIDDLSVQPDQILVQIEYLNGYELTTLMKELTKNQIADVINQICCGISELHEQGITHGSISSDHIYFHIYPDNRIVYKLIETTLSIGQFSQDKYQIHALKMQREEESKFLLKVVLSTATDIWALGVLIYQLFNQNELSNSQKVEQFSNKGNLTSENFNKIPPEYKQIIQGCFVNNSSNRINIKQILEILNYDQAQPLLLNDGILTLEGSEKYREALTLLKSIYNTTNNDNQELLQLCEKMARICTYNVSKVERDQLIQAEQELRVNPRLDQIKQLI